MTVSALIADLGELGIELGQEDGRIWYRPLSAATPELIDRMKAHKPELLVMLRPDTRTEGSADDLLDDLAQRGCLLRLDKAGRLAMVGIPPDLADAVAAHVAELTRILQIEAASMVEAFDEFIDPPDPCPKCGSLELWESVAGDLLGLIPGTWPCLRCNPPTKSRRLRELADRLRRSHTTNRTSGGRQRKRGY